MWNYTSSFDFGATVVIGMWFGIGLQILSETDDRWQSCDVMSISTMAATASQIYFRFQFWCHVAFKNVRIIRIPNLAKMAQSAAEISLFPVSENKRPPYWNSTSSLTLSSSSACDSRSTYQILSKSDHLRPSYDVLATFKMAATASQIYFRFPLLWRIAIKIVKIYLHTKFRQSNSIRG